MLDLNSNLLVQMFLNYGYFHGILGWELKNVADRKLLYFTLWLLFILKSY